jgi:hypothetical protein
MRHADHSGLIPRTSETDEEIIVKRRRLRGIAIPVHRIVAGPTILGVRIQEGTAGRIGTAFIATRAFIAVSFCVSDITDPIMPFTELVILQP